MRKKRSLDWLISRSVQQILSALLLERDEPWYLSDLAKRLRVTPSTLQRPLDSLLKAGIIRRRSEGNRVYFARDPDCPILPELRSLLAKTVGLLDILRESLGPFARGIQIAFVYGSIARQEERSTSDVDLIVVGDVTFADLSPNLKKAEGRLGRPVNATLLSPHEFAEKMARKNHFLCSVVAKDKIFVIGTAHELEESIRARTNRAARPKQSGAG